TLRQFTDNQYIETPKIKIIMSSPESVLKPTNTNPINQRNINKAQRFRTKFDLVKESELKTKISMLSDFSKYVEFIISNKQVLLMRLKDLFVCEHMDLEPEYYNIILLPHDLRSLEWFRSHTVVDKTIDSQIKEISSLIAIYGNYSDGLDR
ncbi:6831_t:CDS:2, partial [Racocetra persica]